jgi:hypothetical protein
MALLHGLGEFSIPEYSISSRVFKICQEVCFFATAEAGFEAPPVMGAKCDSKMIFPI